MRFFYATDIATADVFKSYFSIAKLLLYFHPHNH